MRNVRKIKQLNLYVADTGASNTFTFDKNDFVTFVEDNGTIQTADKKAVLQVQYRLHQTRYHAQG